MSHDDNVSSEYQPDLVLPDDESSSAPAITEDDNDFVPDSLAALFANAESELEAALCLDDISPVKHIQLNGDQNDSDVAESPVIPIEAAPSLSLNPAKSITDTNSTVNFTQVTETKLDEPKPIPSTKKKNITKSSKKRKLRGATAALDLFSPCSDVAGPFDTDMGSACRPNPANQYMTAQAAQDEALGDEDSCSGAGYDCRSSGCQQPGAELPVEEIQIKEIDGHDVDVSGVDADTARKETDKPESGVGVSRRLDFDVAGPGTTGNNTTITELHTAENDKETSQSLLQQVGVTEDPNESQFMPNLSLANEDDNDLAMTMPPAPHQGSTPEPKPLSPPAIEMSHMSLDDEQFFPNKESAYGSTRFSSKNTRKSVGSLATKKKAEYTGRRSLGVTVKNVGSSNDDSRKSRPSSATSKMSADFKSRTSPVSSKSSSSSKPSTGPAAQRKKATRISKETQRPKRLASSRSQVGTTSSFGVTKTVRSVIGKENNKTSEASEADKTKKSKTIVATTQRAVSRVTERSRSRIASGRKSADDSTPTASRRTVSKAKQTSSARSNLSPRLSKMKELGIPKRKTITGKIQQKNSVNPGRDPSDLVMATDAPLQVFVAGGTDDSAGAMGSLVHSNSHTDQKIAEKGNILSQNPDSASDDNVAKEVMGDKVDSGVGIYTQASEEVAKSAVFCVQDGQAAEKVLSGFNDSCVAGAVKPSQAKESAPKRSLRKATKSIDKHKQRMRRSMSARVVPLAPITSKQMANKKNRTSLPAQHTAKSNLTVDSKGEPTGLRPPRKASVPKPPRLSTLERLGEKACPTNRSNPNTPNRSFRANESTQSFDGSASSKPKPRPRITKPIPFNLSESRSATSTPVKSTTMAEGFGDFMRKSLNNYSPIPTDKSRPRELTKAISPNLSRNSTPKRPPPKSTQQLEEEMMEHFRAHPFKAMPIGRGVNSPYGGGGEHGVPKIPKKSLTTPSPFRLHTEMRHSTPGDVPSPMTTEEIQAKECEKQFRARPAPDLSYRPPPMPKSSTPHQLTEPSPFRLHTEIRHSTPGDAPPLMTTEEMQAMECKKQFRARPAPDLSYRPPFTSKDAAPRQLTTPSPFRLHSKSRHSTPGDGPSPMTTEELRAKECEKQFRARPAPDLSYRPPSTQKDTAPRQVTTPSPFRLHTETRYSTPGGAPAPMTSEEIQAKECEKQFRARPLPDLSYRLPSTPKDSAPRQLTTPITLKILERAANKPPPPPSSENDDKKESLFHARPVPKTTYRGPSDSPSCASGLAATPLTVPRPPRLSTGARTEKRIAAMEASRASVTTKLTEKQTVAEKKQREKHLEMLGRLSGNGPVRTELTTPKPFHFQSDARHEAYQTELKERIRKEEEEARRLSVFKAKPVNDGVDQETPSNRPRRSPRKQTSPKPFNLHGVKRYEEAQQSPRVQMEADGNGRHFKARPLPRSTFEAPVMSPRSEHKLVNPQSPKFVSDERAITRSQFDSAVQKKREEEIAAQMKMIEQREKEIEEEIKKLRRMKSTEGGLVYKARSINEKKHSQSITGQDVSDVLEKDERELKRLSSYKARRFSASTKRDLVVPHVKSDRELTDPRSPRLRTSMRLTAQKVSNISTHSKKDSNNITEHRERTGTARRVCSARASRREESKARRRDQSLAVSCNLENLESSLEAAKI